MRNAQKFLICPCESVPYLAADVLDGKHKGGHETTDASHATQEAEQGKDEHVALKCPANRKKRMG